MTYGSADEVNGAIESLDGVVRYELQTFLFIECMFENFVVCILSWLSLDVIVIEDKYILCTLNAV